MSRSAKAERFAIARALAVCVVRHSSRAQSPSGACEALERPQAAGHDHHHRGSRRRRTRSSRTLQRQRAGDDSAVPSAAWPRRSSRRRSRTSGSRSGCRQPETWNGKIPRHRATAALAASSAIRRSPTVSPKATRRRTPTWARRRRASTSRFGVGHREMVVDWGYRADASHDAGRQAGREVLLQARPAAVVFHGLLDWRTPGADRSATLPRGLQRNRRRRSREQPRPPAHGGLLELRGDARRSGELHPHRPSCR